MISNFISSSSLPIFLFLINSAGMSSLQCCYCNFNALAKDRMKILLVFGACYSTIQGPVVQN